MSKTYKVIFKLKLYAKCWFHTLLQFLSIFLFAWFNNCILEMCIIIPCFFYFRKKFEKQYHARTTWLCTFYTLIVFYIVSNISPNLAISVILIIFFTYTINDISFYVRDYLDLRDRFRAKKIEITKGMNKDKLLEICKDNDFNELQTQILIYYYCDRYSLTAISYKVNYSYDYVAELKSKLIKKVKQNMKN